MQISEDEIIISILEVDKQFMFIYDKMFFQVTDFELNWKTSVKTILLSTSPMEGHLLNCVVLHVAVSKEVQKIYKITNF